MKEQKYFAADAPDKLVAYLEKKSDSWFNNEKVNGYLTKIHKSWRAYHGFYYDRSHTIGFSGEHGELVDLPVNHYRSIASNMLSMITATRPAFQPRSINTDRRSLIQTKLASGLLEYYLREQRLERELKRAAEYAIVLGSGYIKMEWNSTRGRIHDYVEPDPDSIFELDEDGNALDENGNIVNPFPIYEGDVEFCTLTPDNVFFDATKQDSESHDWVVTRKFVNKFDLAAKYPELKEEIVQIERDKDKELFAVSSLNDYDETFDIPVFEFYHERTEAMPEGRYVAYINKDIILTDTIIPYKKLPVYRIAASDILGTPYGYTIMWDLLAPQDALNSLYSTILTNQNAFGVQNILNPRGNDVKVNHLEGKLNFIEFNAQVGAPTPLNLTQTPAEIFNMIQILERGMETTSGVNSVARGNPEASLKSGAALALVQSQAIQFVSGLQQQYIQMIEDVGTGLINLLKEFAKVPRIAAIAGIKNRTKMQMFVGEDIESIDRVAVDVGNPLSGTHAGRAQMAEQLLQMGLINKPEQYIQVITTGNLDTLTESENDELDTIRGENERLLMGEEVVVILTDDHAQHIREHKAVLADQELRKDPALVDRTLTHIQEHLQALRTADPDLLAIIGEQPLSPPGGSPANQNVPMPPKGAEGAGGGMANPQAGSVAVADNMTNLPSMPQSAGDPNMPVSAADGMANQS